MYYLIISKKVCRYEQNYIIWYVGDETIHLIVPVIQKSPEEKKNSLSGIFGALWIKSKKEGYPQESADAAFCFILFITFSRVNSSRSFSSRAFWISLVSVSYLGIVIFLRAFARF